MASHPCSRRWRAQLALHSKQSTCTKLGSFRKFVVQRLVPAEIRTLPGPHASSPFCSIQNWLCSVQNWLCSVNNRFVSNKNWLCSAKKRHAANLPVGGGRFSPCHKGKRRPPIFIAMGARHAVVDSFRQKNARPHPTLVTDRSVAGLGCVPSVGGQILTIRSHYGPFANPSPKIRQIPTLFENFRTPGEKVRRRT